MLFTMEANRAKLPIFTILLYPVGVEVMGLCQWQLFVEGGSTLMCSYRGAHDKVDRKSGGT